jgi:hypothetical protein
MQKITQKTTKEGWSWILKTTILIFAAAFLLSMVFLNTILTNAQNAAMQRPVTTQIREGQTVVVTTTAARTLNTDIGINTVIVVSVTHN